MNNDAISVKEHRIVIVIIEITQTSKFTFFHEIIHWKNVF